MPDTTQDDLIGTTFPLRRPVTLAACARIGARRYRRSRDLPGAVPGLLAGDAEAILPRLVAEERRCEQARRTGSAAYRPGQHVQILSALLAEAGGCRATTRETGRKPLLCFSNDAPPSPITGLGLPPGPGRRAAQAKASGSDSLRLAT